MVKIKVRLKVCALKDRIWEIISDVDNDLNFWRGITSIKNLSSRGSTLIREVVLGNNNVCLQMVTSFPYEKVQTKWIKGVIEGTKEISLVSLGRTTLVDIQMNYEFPSVGSSDCKVLARLFQNEAELAAEMIRRISEGCDSEQEPLPVNGVSWVN